VDEVVQVERLRCLGCGVCNVACPSKCLSMERRADSCAPLASGKDLQVSIKESLDKALGEMSKQHKEE